MANTINPRVKVVDFGPSLKLEGRQSSMEITSDEFVYGASRITYKDMSAIDELFKAKTDEKDITEKMKSALIKSAGSGHASMATTPGMWVVFEGDTSKFVDSIFTTARFGSSLMPSGRRVPISKENILVPRAIAEAGEEATKIYMRVSEQNIDAYGTLQQRGVPKEEAAKIVQYGHRGGGFAFMPLETLIYFSREIEHDNGCIPEEGKEIVRQLEDFVKSNGMGVVYEARKAAPRTGCPNPSVFHDRENLAHELADKFYNSLIPQIKISKDNDSSICSPALQERILEYESKKKEVFETKSAFGWKFLLRRIEEIVADFNNTINILSYANTPWRVWGEVKRHRTLSQTAESVYHAVDRATEILRKGENLEFAVSLPDSVARDSENIGLWRKCFSDSIAAYNELVSMGINKSEAIAVIPRGLKLGVVKSFDLYNLTTGYISLRLCNTAEKEMRKITEQERDSILSKDSRCAGLCGILVPKCGYVGFCPEEKFCGNIVKLRPNYTQEMHESFRKERIDDIRAKI
ncbi:MAG: FAD-dependent thymidylate synthase [Candidatus Pacearchaeota archaeon]